MTSIFDQYEQASQGTQRPNPITESMTSSGYINMQLEDTSPMFSKKKMNFNPSDLITHVAIASDYLVLAMANGKLFRMDLKKPDQNEEIQYSKFSQPNSKLTGIFMDPLGMHLLLAFGGRTKETNPELIYLHRRTTKLKPVSKANYHVTEVGWNLENTLENTTGPILLGTSQGLILEMELEDETDKMFLAGQRYWKTVYDIGKPTPITGIQFHKIGRSSKYFIFVTTPERLYQFIGHASTSDDKPVLQSIFSAYLNTPETAFQEIKSNLQYSKLRFLYYDKSNTPKASAWLTESGIFYGHLDPTSQQNSNTLFKQELINYPLDMSANAPADDTPPLSFVLTDFHAFIMYPDRMKAVSLLNHELVYEEVFSEAQGKLKDIVKDHKTGAIWAVTDKAVFRYKITKEERNVWQIYCNKGEFDMAKQYCNNNPAYIDVINIKQAELLFSQQNYEKSAAIFADTQSSFETICLKFLNAEQIDALKVYLVKRLDALSDDDKTLISMIVIWMSELYISQLSQLRHRGKEDTERYHNLQSDFEVFLLNTKVLNCMQYVKPVIYDLMSSHGDKQNLLKLSLLKEDYENVVAQHIYQKYYLEALEILQNLKKPDLFYEFSPSLMSCSPKHTVNALISQGSRLCPSKLLPVFLTCENDEEHVVEIIRYLEFITQNLNVQEQAIHNYLVTLYAEHDSAALMRYLTRQGQDISLVNYDVHYALRLCREKRLSEACVKLSALLGLWESAVELALEVDVGLAKNVANMPDEDPEMQKKLWLKIAAHVMSSNQELKEAMNFLQECSLLKIEDILPFFSDVVTIDHFREPICQSLQEYNNQIEELKADMEEATRSAECVRSEIQTFRHRSAHVSVSHACSLCDIALLLRPFYLFPCGHKFHGDCLCAEVQPALGPAKKNKLHDLQTQLKLLTPIELNTRTSSGLTLHDHNRNEIDNIIASECVFCGETMIQCIDKPFISDEDWDRVMKEWE